MDIRSRIKELKEAMSSKAGSKEIGNAIREDYESRPHRPLNESISPNDTKFYVGEDGMTYYTDGMNYLIIGDESANSLSLREKFVLVKKQVDDLAEGGRINLPKENAYWTRVLKESGDIELIENAIKDEAMDAKPNHILKLDDVTSLWESGSDIDSEGNEYSYKIEYHADNGKFVYQKVIDTANLDAERDDLLADGIKVDAIEDALKKALSKETNEAKTVWDIDPDSEGATEKILATHFAVDEDEVLKVGDHEYEIEGSRYWVGSEEDADEYAKELCRNLIDDMGLKSFSKEYQEYILNDARFFDYDTVRGWMEDSYDSYADDIEDEPDSEFGNRLIKEMHSNGILKDEDFEEDDGIVDHSQLKDSVDLDEKKREFVSSLCQDEDPVQWLKEIYTEDDLAKLVDEEGLIDWDKVAEDCVYTDGPEHFIASYDGKEIQITTSLSAFRLS